LLQASGMSDLMMFNLSGPNLEDSDAAPFAERWCFKIKEFRHITSTSNQKIRYGYLK
jgi:hypothetical protein